ncbi:MAG: heme lyase CcmF/NrfE family subunit, partial [Chloroflexi bacterium]|nr:heme lyase CcmF/NrfE family subunit [Chloroflexota bacterium]
LILFISFLLAIYCTLAAYLGARRGIPQLTASARNGILAYTALTSLAMLALIAAFLARNFSVAIVANSSSRDLSPLLTLTALWSQQAGSLLFWTWILSLYTAAVVLWKWKRDRDLMPYVVAVIMALQTFFAFLLAFISNPFARLWRVGDQVQSALFPPDGATLFFPPDGNGLNPLLQHPLMSAHPPMLYLGFVGFTIPFAFAMAALLSNRVDARWIATIRRWTLLAWVFLGTGLMIGGRWAYDVLGWGGYWGWDPVENSAFMPFLVGTAFIHSVMVQERKGMLKVWNMGLIIITYALVLIGTFLTRSGVITSVHSFAQSDIGAWFLSFIAVVVLLATYLLFTRLHLLKSEHEIDSLLSREAFFLLNNLLFVGAAFAILWGTIYPLFSELIYNTKLTVGPPYFNRIVAPIFGTVLFVMAIIPLIGWGGASAGKLLSKISRPFALACALSAILYALGIRDGVALAGYFLALLVIVATTFEIVEGARARARATRENIFSALRGLFARNRQRYGGYLVHIAVAVIALGIIGSQVYVTDTTRALQPGETMQVRGYTLRFDGVSPLIERDEAVITSARLTAFRDGQPIATLTPARNFYPRQQNTQTIPAIISTPQEDLYVIIAGWEENFATVTFRAYLNPLVFFVWFGGLLLIVSTLIAAFPELRVEATARATVPKGVAPEAH